MVSKQISWSGSLSGTYEVQYKKSTDTNWTNAQGSPIVGNNITLANLADNTNYQVRVRSLCDDRVSPWLYDNFLTGNSSCPVVTNIAVGTITSTTANVSWTGASGAIGYIVQHRKSTDSNWITSPTVLTTSYQLTLLTSLTAYQVRIITLCTSGQQTSSSNLSFSTI